MTITTVLALLVVTLVLLSLGLLSLDQGRTQRRTASRRARMTGRRHGPAPWRRAVHSVALQLPFGRSVDDRLRQAGIGTFLAGDAILLAAAAAVAVWLLAGRLMAAVVAAILGFATLVIANRYLDRLVRRRAEKFADQLPDIARIMSNAASAGMSIPNALSLTAGEMDEPARSLLGHAVRQMEVGQTLAGAMDQLQERAPSREMAVLVSTLVIQQRAGGDVIEALREMSVNLEARRDLKREVDTTMAGVRATAYAVMGLGIAMLFVLESIQAGTLRRFTERPIGQVVLVIALSLYAAGYVAMRRLSKVEV